MNIEVKEFTDFKHYNECLDLQGEIFGLKDADKVPSPLLRMLNGRAVPRGILLGAFIEEDGREKMVGYMINVATLNVDSIYCMMIGVLPQYHNLNIGFLLISRLQKIALEKNIRYFYCIYELLEGRLGKFYFDKIGLFGIKYEVSAFELAGKKELPIDVFLVYGDFAGDRLKKRLSEAPAPGIRKEFPTNCPIVNEDRWLDAETVLVEIPEDFQALKKFDMDTAIRWRLSTRKIFDEYINRRQYYVAEFFTVKENAKRSNYYMLKKKREADIVERIL